MKRSAMTLINKVCVSMSAELKIPPSYPPPVSLTVSHQWSLSVLLWGRQRGSCDWLLVSWFCGLWCLLLLLLLLGWFVASSNDATITKWRRGDLIMPIANIIIYLKLCTSDKRGTDIFTLWNTKNRETVEQLDLICVLGQLWLEPALYHSV